MVDRVLEGFIAAEACGNFKVDHSSITKGEAYTQFYVAGIGSDDLDLKIEFVNDVAQHYGEIVIDPVLGRIDSLRNILSNILSNKLTALFRSEPKDVADIYAIASQLKEIDWREIVIEAKTKEAGADPEILYDILRSFPLSELERIKWIDKPEPAVFGDAIKIIAEDILYGRKNSLHTVI